MSNVMRERKTFDIMKITMHFIKQSAKHSLPLLELVEHVLVCLSLKLLKMAHTPLNHVSIFRDKMQNISVFRYFSFGFSLINNIFSLFVKNVGRISKLFDRNKCV